MPRALPPNPSLEQLKHQAKDLLKTSRALDLQALLRIEQYLPDRAAVATLADTQLVIAREYGFASWPKLKRQIEALVAQQAVALEQPRIVPRRESLHKLRIRQIAEHITESAASGAISQVLAALVIPALAGAKERARRASCKSSMRQFALAVHMYGDENDQQLPPGASNKGANDDHLPVLSTVTSNAIVHQRVVSAPTHRRCQAPRRIPYA